VYTVVKHTILSISVNKYKYSSFEYASDRIKIDRATWRHLQAAVGYGMPTRVVCCHTANYDRHLISLLLPYIFSVICCILLYMCNVTADNHRVCWLHCTIVWHIHSAAWWRAENSDWAVSCRHWVSSQETVCCWRYVIQYYVCGCLPWNRTPCYGALEINVLLLFLPLVSILPRDLKKYTTQCNEAPGQNCHVVVVVCI